jgi:type II secretory pathway pseudopilin PulG
MTAMQKIAMVCLLTAAVATSMYEARQAANARAELASLQQLQAQADQQIDDLQRQHNESLTTTHESKSGPGRASEPIEISRLRGEVAQLRSELNDLPTHRATRLKQKLEQMPDKAIPELQFLTDKEWLTAAWDADLDSDDGVRLALRKLRDQSVDRFLNQMRTAIRAYAAGNDDLLPPDLFQLKGYFQTPVTDEMLQRYKLLQTGKLSEVSRDSLVRKVSYADPDYDSRQEMSINGGGGSSFNRIEEAINDAAREFARNNEFQTPVRPDQIAAYLDRTIDPGTVQKYLDKFAKEPPSPEELTMVPVMKAYRNDHSGAYPQEAADLLPYITTPDQQAALQKIEAKRH